MVFQSKHLIAFLEQPSQADNLQVLKLALCSVTNKIKRFGPLQNHRINVGSLNFFKSVEDAKIEASEATISMLTLQVGFMHLFFFCMHQL